MLLRYHWGLGVGHTYSHVRDGAADEVFTGAQSSSAQGSVQYDVPDHSCTVAGNLLAHPNEFNDLENKLSVADLDVLEWELPENGAESAPDLAIATSISLAHPDGFDNLDASFSLADLDTFEWVVESQDTDEGDSESDDDSGCSVMYEMYGSDRGDNNLLD